MVGPERGSTVNVTTKGLLAASACALALAGTTAAATPPAADYPWVQLPAWVGTGSPQAPASTAAYPWAQPPASVPATSGEQNVAVPGCGYTWTQLPAWVGTSESQAPLPTAACPDAQPPAWIPAR